MSLLIDQTQPSLCFAAGWLAAAARRLLGNRSYLDRSIVAIVAVNSLEGITLEFVNQLDRDIRAECRHRGIEPPDLKEIFAPALLLPPPQK